MSFEPFIVSTAIVALAEMGDKTQLATVALAARVNMRLTRWIAAASFLALGALTLLGGVAAP